MFCDHCGKQIPDDAVLCPYCGVSTDENKHVVTYFGDVAQQYDKVDSSLHLSKDDFSHFGGPQPGSRQPLSNAHAPHQHYQGGYRAVPSAAYSPSSPPVSPFVYPVQQPGYGPQAMNYQGYPAQMSQLPQSPQFVPVVPVVVTGQTHMKSENAVLLEVILSLFGVFGMGWLAGGETTVGIILLICSFVIYLPILFLGTIFTFGIGLLCLGPLAIVAIIINAILCNSMLKRKEVRMMYMQQSPIVHGPSPVQRHVQQ